MFSVVSVWGDRGKTVSPHQLLLITALKQGDWQEREEWDVCVVGSKVVCICGQWHDCALCQGGLLCGCIGMCES